MDGAVALDFPCNFRPGPGFSMQPPMKRPPWSLLAASLLAAAIVPAQAKIERTVEKTFTVQPGGTLHAATFGGSISIRPSGDSAVKVVAKETISAATEAEADEAMRKCTLTVE